jgi:hypothetical protein
MESNEEKTNVILCSDFNDAYSRFTTSEENVNEEEVLYQVKVQDIDSSFGVWRENKELKSKYNGNFFNILHGDSTKTLVKFKSYPAFVRYECVDELNASILHLVCYFGLSEFVEDFVSPENCRRPGNFSYTPLHYACMNPMNPMRPGDLKTIQEIIKVAGAEACTDRSIHGFYPINYTHNDEVVQYLQEVESQLENDKFPDDEAFQLPGVKLVQ